MEKIDIVDVLSLCDQFKNTSEAFVKSKPELQQKAVEVMTPHIETFMGKAEELQEIAGDALWNVSSQEEANEWMRGSEDYQRVTLEVMEIIASATSQLLNPEEIQACLPEGLRGNLEAAELLRERNAPQMAAFCDNTPA